MQFQDKIILSFVFPFWTETVAKPMEVGQRLEKTRELCKSLNSGKRNLDWEVIPYAHPPSLVRRKVARLQTSVTDREPQLEAFFATCDQTACRLLSYQWQIEYFDLGLGTCELLVEVWVDWSRFEVVADCLGRARESIISIGRVRFFEQPQDKPDFEIAKTMGAVDAALAKSFTQLRLSEVNWFVSENLAYEGSRLKSQNCNMFIFLDGPIGDGPITEMQLAEFLEEYAGGSVDINSLRTGNRTAPFVFCSNSGAAAIVRDLTAMRRISRLWKTVIMYWGAMYECADGAYKKSLQFNSATLSKDLVVEVQEVGMARHLINQIIFEARPENLTSDNFEKTAYERFWHSWATDDLLNTLKEQAAQLDQRLIDLNNQLSQAYSNRVSTLLLIITVITVAGVSAEVAGFYDFDNTILSKHIDRVGIILATVLFFTLLSGAFLLGRGRRKPR